MFATPERGVQIGETLVLEAKYTGAADRFNYEWTCPEELAFFCQMEQMEKGRLYLPYADETYFSYVIFDKTYEFGVKITAIGEDGQVAYEDSQTVEVSWETPKIDLECV